MVATVNFGISYINDFTLKNNISFAQASLRIVVSMYTDHGRWKNGFIA